MTGSFFGANTARWSVRRCGRRWLASTRNQVCQGVWKLACTAALVGNESKAKPAVLFYTTDDARAVTQVERLIRIAGFEPMAVDGGVQKSGRIEVGGDLHAFGGLNGPLLDQEEAASLLRSSKQTVV
jgi:hypothetical protein